MMKLQQLDNEGNKTDVVKRFQDNHALAILAIKNSKWVKVEEKPEPPKERRKKSKQIK